jgi:hypothetical protein
MKIRRMSSQANMTAVLAGHSTLAVTQGYVDATGADLASTVGRLDAAQRRGERI